MIGTSSLHYPSPLRVVQWATGNIGAKSLRAVIEHPGLDLVGVYVHSSEKVGRDAGSLCGLGPIGVIATNDLEEILDLGANCVLYMPAHCDVEEVCQLLSLGSNVVTTRGEFHRPASMDPEVRERIEKACAPWCTSLHSTGSSPGFITEALPLVLTSLQRRLDQLTIDEFANLSERPSPELLFGVMGFGQAPSHFGEARLGHLRNAFGPSLQSLAESLGLPLDAVEASGEVALATHQIKIAAGAVEAGSVAAQRITVSGIRNGEELVRFRANWYCSKDLDQDWELQDTGWRVGVHGDTPLDVRIDLAIPLESMADTAPGYTAHRAVNAIASVCAAPAGILTTAELPQIVADLRPS